MSDKAWHRAPQVSEQARCICDLQTRLLKVSVLLPLCRYGECVWDERSAAKLKYILESSVQRRFPRGLKMLMKTG